MIFSRHMPSSAPLPYVQGGKRTLIFTSVSLFHAALIVVPLLLYSLSSLLNPPLSVTKVSLVDSPPNEHETPSKYPSPDRAKPLGTPDIGDPKKLTDIPDVPDLPEPVPQTKPEPEAQKPVPQKKTEPDVRVKPQKTKPVPPKPKQKIKSPNEIKRSTKIVRRSNPAQSAQRNAEAARRRDIGKLLREAAENKSPYGISGGKGIAGGGGGPVGRVDRELIAYYDKVAAYLKRNWNQPSKASLNNTLPKVEVKLRIDSAGRVIAATVVCPSGVRAMDASVDELIRNLKVLPNPPKAMEFIVTLEIDPWQ